MLKGRIPNFEATSHQGYFDSKSFQKAISLDSNNVEAHTKLASLFLFQKRHQEAETTLKKALKLDHNSVIAHTTMARVYQIEKNWNDSMRHLVTALQIDPEFAPAHVFIGVALLQKKRMADAIKHFRRAIHLNPDLPDAQAHLANVLASTGDLGQAAIHYRNVLKLKPNDDGVELKLAWCLATCHDHNIRSGAEAVRLAERLAITTNRQSTGVLDVLAAAYAEMGDFRKALETIAEAAELAKSDPKFLKALEQRRQLYLHKKPVRAGKKTD